MEAYDVRVRRLASGVEDDDTAEAEAGALLRAEADQNLHVLTGLIHSFLTRKTP